MTYCGFSVLSDPVVVIDELLNDSFVLEFCIITLCILMYIIDIVKVIV